MMNANNLETEKRMETMQAEIDRLKEALSPFAHADFSDDVTDSAQAFFRFDKPIGDTVCVVQHVPITGVCANNFRRARAVFNRPA
jgi:hypothetical protein